MASKNRKIKLGQPCLVLLTPRRGRQEPFIVNLNLVIAVISGSVGSDVIISADEVYEVSETVEEIARAIASA